MAEAVSTATNHVSVTYLEESNKDDEWKRPSRDTYK